MIITEEYPAPLLGLKVILHVLPCVTTPLVAVSEPKKCRNHSMWQLAKLTDDDIISNVAEKIINLKIISPKTK